MVIRISDVRHERGDYASLDDRMLVLDFQAGNPEAFVEIHNRYGNLARHVCRRLLANAHDTDEAFQETMIRVFQGLYRFNGRYALQPWISRIATNVSLDMIRSKTRRPIADEALEDHDHAVVVEGPEESFDRLVERDLVLSVLSDLPDSHRRALILRELEGRSHREIGNAMGISPSQAKALIHRAKGSFRRRWMEKAADRSGLAGIALLPVLWVIRLADTARRVADRAGHAAQAAQAAAPDVVSSAASSTVASAAGSGFGERVLAAGMTLLVAGGVTVGAATIAKDRGNDDQAVRAEASASLADAPALEPDVSEPQPRLDQIPRKEPQGPPDVREDPVVVEPAPTVLPSPEPTAPPSPPSAESPPPEPSPEPPAEPTPPPAPGWTYDFVSSTASVESCTCDGTSRATSQVEWLEGGGFRFSQVIKGGARDSAGDLTWPFFLQQWGEFGPSGGQLEYRFGLTSAGGMYLYGGAAVLAERVTGDDGSTTYRFEGTFDLINPQSPVAGLPWRGFVSATIGVWADGTIYTGALTLSDASA